MKQTEAQEIYDEINKRINDYGEKMGWWSIYLLGGLDSLGEKKQ